MTDSFVDHTLGKKIKAASVDFFRVSGNTVEFGGFATVNGKGSVRYSVVAQDGDASESFRVITSDGYLAGGALTTGNVQVSGQPSG